MPKAPSFAVAGLIPTVAAADSWSRTAMSDRPNRLLMMRNAAPSSTTAQMSDR